MADPKLFVSYSWTSPDRETWVLQLAIDLRESGLTWPECSPTREEREWAQYDGKPVRTYSVAGLYDDLVEQGRIIRKEEDGLHIILDLEKQDRASAIRGIKDVLSQLEE